MTDDDRGIIEDAALEQLRRFMLDNVSTYEELDTLLALQRQRDVAWTVEAAAATLGLSADVCRVALDNLAAQELLVIDDEKFRYAPSTIGLAAAAEQLQRLYHEDRVAIVQLMTKNALDRVRAAAAGRLSLRQRQHAKSSR